MEQTLIQVGSLEEKTVSKVKQTPRFKEYEQNRNFLFPTSTDDFIDKRHIARLISYVVDHIDLDFILSKYQGGGTTAYHPRMMLKVWLLGVVSKIYTSRKLERALHENIPFLWISGFQKPDFKTLNDFRLRLGGDIKVIFKEVVLMGVDAGIITGENVFLDHTKMEANANSHKMVWRKSVEKRLTKIDEELNQLFVHIDSLNLEEDKKFGNRKGFTVTDEEMSGERLNSLVGKINEKLKSKEMTKEEGTESKANIRRVKELQKREDKYEKQAEILGKRNSYSRTDSDASAMKMKRSDDIKPAYNEGITTENRFVTGYVVSQSAADNVSFTELMDETISNLEKTPDTITTDGAYGNCENFEYIEGKNIGNYAKYNGFHKEGKDLKEGENFRKEHFQYDEGNDSFTCPNGQTLKFQNTKTDETKTGYKNEIDVYAANESLCSFCPLKNKCTAGKHRTLNVNWKLEEYKNKVRVNLKSDKGIELRKRRCHDVETVFAEKKSNHGYRRYLLRGLEKVKIEAGLFYTAYNLKKLYFFILKKMDSTQFGGKNAKLMLSS